MVGGTAPCEAVGGVAPVDVESGRGCRRLVPYPCHRGNECRCLVELAHEVIDAPCVVGQELRAEVAVSDAVLAQEMEFACDILQRPVAFARRQEVDA